MSYMYIKRSGVQSGTDRTLWVTYAPVNGLKHIKEYSYIWKYSTGDGVWFIGEKSTTTSKQSTYTAPENATSVKFVVKAVSSTYSDELTNNKEVHYWTDTWSTAEKFKMNRLVSPETPSTPTVSIDEDGYTLTVRVDSSDSNTTGIEFYIVKDDKYKFRQEKVSLVKGTAKYQVVVPMGHEYKARARAYKIIKSRSFIVSSVDPSDWSDYSSNVGTVPDAPTWISKNPITADTSTSVKCQWNKNANATGYKIEYTTKKEYFDASSSNVSSVTIDSNITSGYVTGLETGQEWFFRLRATNSNGDSSASAIQSLVLGKKPSAPTTWSSTSTANVGDKVYLYWVHNAQDNSSQTTGQIHFDCVNSEGVTKYSTTVTVKNSTDEDLKDLTSVYTLDTTGSIATMLNLYVKDGGTFKWKVRTQGVLTGDDDWSDWSIERELKIYTPASLSMTMSDNIDSDDILEGLPITLNIQASPSNQSAVSYYLTLTSNEGYETLDYDGETITVKSGDVIYSKYYNAGSTNSETFTISASDVTLENNVSYTVACTVSMDSGLTAETSTTFTVEWATPTMFPLADIIVDSTALTAKIRPYCVDSDGNRVANVKMAVFRREYDGTFTSIIDTEIDNTEHSDLLYLYATVENDDGSFSNSVLQMSNSDLSLTDSSIQYYTYSDGYTWVVDPHPALDYARYRIVAKSTITGTVAYSDLPGHPIGEDSAVIQWDDDWHNFDILDTDADGIGNEAEPSWSGSMLKLPYNLDVSDSGSLDVSHVEYIGRRHPVSYYGTQVGETSSWSVDIPKSDTETLYQLRRLKSYLGDCYVREPSGSGYWATVQVSFTQTHCEVVIPVTLDITRVDGGA